MRNIIVFALGVLVGLLFKGLLMTLFMVAAVAGIGFLGFTLYKVATEDKDNLSSS